MNNTTLFKITLVGIALVAVGVATYTLLSRLSDQTLSAIAGAAAVLTVVVVVGTLFLARDALQTRLLRRQMAQDNFDDLKQMAMVFKLLGGGRASNVNVKVPEQQAPTWPSFLLPASPPAQLPEPNQPWRYDGAYRDTTLDHDVELE
jgi:hypothetical protein